MFDFRLRVFYSVATKGGFTKAAQDLGISQPAVTKHIKEIESHYQVQLFNRHSIPISLTAQGEMLLVYAKDIFDLYNKLSFDLQTLGKGIEGKIRIGASTTITQYVLSALLANFRSKLSDVQVEVFSESSAVLEHLLIDNRIDVALVENPSDNARINYQELIKDPIVLVCRVGNPYVQSQTISVKDLFKLSFLLREKGSGTLELVSLKLKEMGIDINDLNCEMTFSSTESIKMYLMHSNSFAFISQHAIVKELKYKELRIINIACLEISRYFDVIQMQGQNNTLVKTFVDFAKSYDFKL